MGTSYTIYAEVRVRDKWFSINPYVRKINGEVKMIPLDSWGSIKTLSLIQTEKAFSGAQAQKKA